MLKITKPGGSILDADYPTKGVNIPRRSTVGAAVALDGPLVLAMVAPAIAVIHGFVIRREEAYMAQKFGVDYERYTATVRRWV